MFIFQNKICKFKTCLRRLKTSWFFYAGQLSGWSEGEQAVASSQSVYEEPGHFLFPPLYQKQDCNMPEGAHERVLSSEERPVGTEW